MKNRTEKNFATLLQRTCLLILSVTLIYSCDSDDLEYDCEELEANYGDACDSAGVIDFNCECISDYSVDSTSTEYDCQDLMLNIGDSCDGFGLDSIGYVDTNCDCITLTDSSEVNFDCPDLYLNYGDSCSVDSIGMTWGVVNLDCNCE